MARKGKDKVPKIDPKLEKLGDVLTGMKRVMQADSAAKAPAPRPEMTREARVARLIGLGMTPEEVEQQLAVTAHATAPTTVCTHHVGRADDLSCARCGMPFKELAQKRWKDTIDAARASEERFEPEPSALDSFLTEDEKQAPYAAVLTAEQLEAVLDSPEPAGFAGMVEVHPTWLDRAKTMADADGFTVPEFIERLIKRQWIASGAKRRT